MLISFKLADKMHFLLRVFQHRIVQRKSKASWIGGIGETKEGSQDKEDGSHVD